MRVNGVEKKTDHFSLKARDYRERSNISLLTDFLFASVTCYVNFFFTLGSFHFHSAMDRFCTLARLALKIHR